MAVNAPLLRATDERWESNFGRFVLEFGATSLAGRLKVHRSAVYQWIRGAAAPEPGTAVAIRDLARAKGFTVSLEDIYTQVRPRIRIRRRHA